MSKFWKMNGAGNDFVVIDNRDHSLDLSRDQIALLCERQRGVGADGLLAVEPGQNGAEYRMRYYNADGGEAEMCGNGARCFARFLNFLNGENLDSTSFETIAGVIGAEFVGEQVRIALSTPFDESLHIELDLGGAKHTLHAINTGVPHVVEFPGAEALGDINIRELGSAIRFHDRFAPAGTNVNFAGIDEPGALTIRTYERGVEDETLACGTGMAAAALIYARLHDWTSPVSIRVAGGDVLEIDFEKSPDDSFKNVSLLGPAEFTFEGNLLVPSISDSKAL